MVCFSDILKAFYRRKSTNEGGKKSDVMVSMPAWPPCSGECVRAGLGGAGLWMPNTGGQQGAGPGIACGSDDQPGRVNACQGG